ncbi:replication initiation factor domain-containing protein [Bacillus altitudinis]|uniref:replication initiation factor domain-containing protein n=1 Tax=Bacillus altitudinis TaxID=293387 RepID=UPI003D02BEBA
MSGQNNRLSGRAVQVMLDREAADGERKDPRIVTRGSFSSKAKKTKQKSRPQSRDDLALSDLLAQFRFDWFQFTIPATDGGGSCVSAGSPEERDGLDAALAWADNEGLHIGRPRGGANGYRISTPFLGGPEGERLASVASGSATGVMPNVTITGGDGAAASLAGSAQRAFPGLRLSRADAALDRSMPGLWDRLHRMAVTLSRANSKIGSVRTIQSDTGRTFYLGSPKSTVSLRVYEKDRERLAAGKISPDECDDDLVRIEWTFRPQSRAKVGAGRLSPGELVRSSVWARDFMSRAAKIMEETEGMAKPKRVQIEREARVSSLEESARHGAAQYGGVFARLAAARIIAARGDDYAQAVLTPGEIEAEAAILFREFVADTVAGQRVIDAERLSEPETPEARRAATVGAIIDMAVRLAGEQDVAGAVADDAVARRVAAAQAGPGR